MNGINVASGSLILTAVHRDKRNEKQTKPKNGTIYIHLPMLSADSYANNRAGMGIRNH